MDKLQFLVLIVCTYIVKGYASLGLIRVLLTFHFKTIEPVCMLRDSQAALSVPKMKEIVLCILYQPSVSFSSSLHVRFVCTVK